MSNLKPGDLCVTVNANSSFEAKHFNAYVTVVSWVHRQESNGMDFYTVEEFPRAWFARNELILRRPKQWDDFIFDTSKVDDEVTA